MRAFSNRSRSSSKYRSTSPSWHIPSKASQPSSAPNIYIPQPTPNHSYHFIDGNQEILSQFIKIIKQQSLIMNQHQEWYKKTASKIANSIEMTKSQVNNILNEQQAVFRKVIQKEYLCFISMFSEIKEGVRELYRQKVQLEKYMSVEKGIVSKYKKLNGAEDYYGSPYRQNYHLVNQMQKENEEREDFRSLNSFYNDNRANMERLNLQVSELLAFPQRISQREEQIQIHLKKLIKTVQHGFNRSKENIIEERFKLVRGIQ